MKDKHFSKTEMARRMHTSRAALSTLQKAALVVGRQIRLELI